VGETVNTLEFGSRAMRIEVDAKVNASMVEVNANTLVDDLKTSFDDLGFSLGPELDAVRRASCEAIESAQDEVRFRQRAVESAEKISQSLTEKVASAQIEVQSLLEKEKILTKEVESRRKLYQDMCAKNEDQCVKIEQLEAQLAAYQSAASSPNDASSNEVLSLKAQIVDMESREKVMQDELAVARRAVSDKDAERKAETEKLAKERDDAVRVASEAKQKAAPKQRRSDEDDALIHRLRREVIQLTDQLRSVKASNADDNAQVGKAPAAQELPRTSQRVRTPTPPARFRPGTPHQSSRNATNYLSRTSPVESTNLTRTPFSDLTNSIMKDAADKDPIKDRAEIGASVAMSPNKTPVKTYGLSSPMGFRSPKVFEHIDDAADIAAGRQPRSPSPKPSPLSSQAVWADGPNQLGIARSFEAMGSLHGSNFYLSKESTTKVFEERPRYNVYGDVSVRSALKSQPKFEASKVRNVHFTAEEPVPRSPPKWYMDHLEVLRNPTALANLRYTQNLDNARSPQGDYSPSPSPAARSGTVGNTPRQFTPPPRKLRPQGDASKTSRWRS